jgi:hypothetical protein
MIAIMRLLAALSLTVFTRPAAGRHRVGRQLHSIPASSGGFYLATLDDGTIIEANAFRRDEVVYLTVRGPEGVALAALGRAEACALGAGLLREASSLGAELVAA